jgi:glycerol-3-phosphate acyltransferase PlsY
MDFFVKVLLAYLLGSVVGSLVVGRLRGGVDIRKSGSGNAGCHQRATHAGRGVRHLGHRHRHREGLDRRGAAAGARTAWRRAFESRPGCLAARGLCVRRHPRHVFPVWHGFQGGKGVATLVGAYAGFDLTLLIPLFASWLGVVMVSGFVGLASIIAAFAMPVYLLMRDGAVLTPALGFALACAALVAFTHRGNVRRMRAGTEPRARRLWLFGRGRA